MHRNESLDRNESKPRGPACRPGSAHPRRVSALSGVILALKLVDGSGPGVLLRQEKETALLRPVRRACGESPRQRRRILRSWAAFSRSFSVSRFLLVMATALTRTIHQGTPRLPDECGMGKTRCLRPSSGDRTARADFSRRLVVAPCLAKVRGEQSISDVDEL